jgi:hypothetical protein
VTQLRRQGITTEISLKNDEIKERNFNILMLDNEIKVSENLIEDLRKAQQNNIDDLFYSKNTQKINEKSSFELLDVFWLKTPSKHG